MSIDEVITKCVDNKETEIAEWLNELKHYRKKNKVFNNELKVALDKQIERKTQIIAEIKNDRIVKTLICPRCNEKIIFINQKYCHECGQKIKGVK